jgi:hypothetical protein
LSRRRRALRRRAGLPVAIPAAVLRIDPPSSDVGAEPLMTVVIATLILAVLSIAGGWSLFRQARRS